MDKDKENQEISLIGRLFSVEALLILMGIVCLVSGGLRREPLQIFWGVMIVTGSVVLHFVRKRDWKKHWEEQELLRRRYEEKMRQRKDADGKQ